MGLEVDVTCELTFKLDLHSVIPGAFHSEEADLVLAVTDLLSTVHNVNGHLSAVVKNFQAHLLTLPVGFFAAVNGAV
jgi:hypothetical protein